MVVGASTGFMWGQLCGWERWNLWFWVNIQSALSAWQEKEGQLGDESLHNSLADAVQRQKLQVVTSCISNGKLDNSFHTNLQKVGEKFEAFGLEMPSSYQLQIPEELRSFDGHAWVYNEVSTGS